MTDKLPYAEVIGDPIAHSKSPLIHNFWLQSLGIEAEYRKTHVKPDGLAAYFLERRADPDWLGCNVTIPHKIAVMDYTDDPGGVRERIGAMNTIACETGGPLVGTNTDAGGFLQPLLRDKWKGQSAVLVGAGGGRAPAGRGLLQLPPDPLGHRAAVDHVHGQLAEAGQERARGLCLVPGQGARGAAEPAVLDVPREELGERGHARGAVHLGLEDSAGHRGPLPRVLHDRLDTLGPGLVGEGRQPLEPAVLVEADPVRGPAGLVRARLDCSQRISPGALR